jgi:PAS domain S-box-containing protein
VSDVTPSSAPSRRLAPHALSVRDARRFLEAALPGSDPDTMYTAKLLISELVTNAVLHAGTEIEVRAWEAQGRVHVRVFDGAATRLPIPYEQTPEAGTGRGLHMVEHLSAACGVEVSPGGKTVWFELWPEATDLKPGATWAVSGPRSGEGMNVSLLDLPVGLSRAAQRHRAALLREARLVFMSGRTITGVTSSDILAVAELNDTLDSALSAAASRDPEAASLSLQVAVPRDCAQVALRLSEVIDALNAAARSGMLLTRPSLPEVRRLRMWMLNEVATQLDGGPASRWVGRDELQGRASLDELMDYDPTDVHARVVPAIAGDDDNTILAVNDAAASLLGWKPEELVGERVTVLVPPSWRERHVAGFTNFLLTGESSVIGKPTRLPALHRDGRTVDVLLRIDVEQSRHGRTVFVAELEPAGSAADDKPSRRGREDQVS